MIRVWIVEHSHPTKVWSYVIWADPLCSNR